MQISSNFEQAFTSYLNTKDLDSKTINSYTQTFHKFINLYPELNQRSIDLFLKNNTSSPARAMIKNLKSSLLRWDLPQDVKNEIGSIDIPNLTGKKDRKIPKFLQKSDLNRLELGITDERIKLMVLVQFYAGLRLSELIGLSYESFNKEEYDKHTNDEFQSIKISSESAKFGKERISYLPTYVYIRVLKWIKEEISKKSVKFEKTKPIWNLKKSRYSKLLSEWTKKILGESYNPHSLRHGRGTDLILNEKKSIDIVKGYLGHADIGSTQVYAHISDKNIKDSLEGNTNSN